MTTAAQSPAPPLKTNPAAPDAAKNDHPNVPFFPPVLPLSGLAIGVALQFIAPLPLANFWPALLPRLGLAVPLILLGGAILAGAGRALRSAGTNVNPSEPTLSLVRKWPFTFTRNPMYLGGNLVYLGVAIAFRLDWMLALFPVSAFLCHYLVVRPEETYLEDKFGAEYFAYKARVRRWL